MTTQSFHCALWNVQRCLMSPRFKVRSKDCVPSAVPSLLSPGPTGPSLSHPQVMEAHPLLSLFSPLSKWQQHFSGWLGQDTLEWSLIPLSLTFSHLIHQLSLHLFKIQPPLRSSIAPSLIWASISSYQHPCKVLPSGLSASVFPFTTISSSHRSCNG